MASFDLIFELIFGVIFCAFHCRIGLAQHEGARDEQGMHPEGAPDTLEYCIRGRQVPCATCTREGETDVRMSTMMSCARLYPTKGQFAYDAGARNIGEYSAGPLQFEAQLLHHLHLWVRVAEEATKYGALCITKYPETFGPHKWTCDIRRRAWKFGSRGWKRRLKLQSGRRYHHTLRISSRHVPIAKYATGARAPMTGPEMQPVNTSPRCM